jgi:endo-1,4-beta-xylanase
VKNIKRINIYYIIFLPISILFFTSQQNLNNINGFIADAGSFEILNSYQGRNNVLKVDRSKTQWSIARYSLAQYRGRQVAIEFSADIRIEGSASAVTWQVNNPPNFPTVSQIENAVQGQWQSMRGRIIVTPSQSDAVFYLTNWGVPANTIFYIANPTITITEGDFLTPDLSLTPLKSVYANDFLMGNITDNQYMSGRHFDLLRHHYNVVTSVDTFPFQLAPQNKGGAYQFANADRTTNLMIRNNIQVIGHALVYLDYSPAWMTEGTREDVIQNMNDYITTVVRHFRGRINTWDVVNEAVRNNLTAADVRGDWRNCLHDSRSRSGQWSPRNPWYEKLGADYIELAFRAARNADPNIKLYYNDHALEDPNKAEVVRKMILDINDRYKRETGGTRNLIEGVGSQAHIGSTETNSDLNLNINNVRNALNRLASLGIEIAITEMDISTVGYNRGSGKDSAMSERDAMAQALLYARLMSLYREFSAHIVRVTFWGIDDNTSWLSSGNPTLFDWKLNAKPAFHAVSDPDSFLRQHGGRSRR